MMRFTATARALTLSLALAAAAAPAAPAAAQTSFSPAPAAGAAPAQSAAAAWAGVYRIDVAKGDEVLPMRVVVERAGPSGGLDGTVLLGGTASALANVRYEAGELRAVMVTSTGKGELVLRQTEAGVAGTLRIGKTTWTVTGERSA